jgi:hypothetical protein
MINFLIVFPVSIAFFSTSFSLFDFFNAFFVILLSFVASILISYFLKPLFSLNTFFNKIIFFIIMSFSTFYCLIYPAWLPHRRDPSGYMMQAVNISKYKSLINEDILSKPQHSLNNYDLSEGEYTSQFLPAYSSYLATFFTLFGVEGMIRANFFIVIGVLLSLYAVIKNILNSKSDAIIYILLIVNSFAFIWFSKKFSSEILFMLGIWASLAYLISGIEKKRLSLISISLLISSFLPLIRIEGLIISPFFLVIALHYLLDFSFKNLFKRSAVVFLSTILNLFLYYKYLSGVHSGYVLGTFSKFPNSLLSRLKIDLTLNVHFFLFLLVPIFLVLFYLIYKSIVKHEKTFFKIYLLGLILFLSFDLLNIFRPSTAALKLEEYLLISPMFLGSVILFTKRDMDKKRINLIIPILIINSISLAFFIEPGIAKDHPWFLRRYFYSIVPLSYFLTTLGLKKIKNNIYKYMLMFLLLVFSVLTSLPIYTFQENKGVGIFANEVKNYVNSDDFLFVDPGWQWQQFMKILRYPYNLKTIPNTDGYSNEDLTYFINENDKVFYLTDKKDLDKTEFINKIEEINLHYNCLGWRYSSLSQLPPIEKRVCEERLYLYLFAISGNYRNQKILKYIK